jgi:hypothetical protein
VAERAHLARRQLRRGPHRPRALRRHNWPYVVIGAGFGVLGLAFILFALIRQRQVDRALATGTYAPFDDRIALVLTVAGLLLGAGTILIVIVQS